MRTHQPSPVLLTRRDIELLRWLTLHRFAATRQLARLMSVGERGARWRADRLRQLGFLDVQSLPKGSGTAWIPTRLGATVVDLEWKRQSFSWATHRHVLAVTDKAIDLHLAGEVVVSEREMRREDQPYGEWQTNLRYAATAIGGNGPHLPDLFVEREHGGREAIEVELTRKASREWVRVMGAYRPSRHIDVVTYYTPDESILDGLVRAVHAAGAHRVVRIVEARLVFGLTDRSRRKC